MRRVVGSSPTLRESASNFTKWEHKCETFSGGQLPDSLEHGGVHLWDPVHPLQTHERPLFWDARDAGAKHRDQYNVGVFLTLSTARIVGTHSVEEHVQLFYLVYVVDNGQS